MAYLPSRPHVLSAVSVTPGFSSHIGEFQLRVKRAKKLGKNCGADAIIVNG
jgi:hypothetical protein